MGNLEVGRIAALLDGTRWEKKRWTETKIQTLANAACLGKQSTTNGGCTSNRVDGRDSQDLAAAGGGAFSD